MNTAKMRDILSFEKGFFSNYPMIIILNRNVNYLLQKKKGEIFSKIGKVYNPYPQIQCNVTKVLSHGRFLLSSSISCGKIKG